MTLYHGSNQDIVEVDLLKGMSFKDFGRGFYLTPDYDTACRMAKKKARMLKGVPTVIEMNWTKLCWRMDRSACYAFQRRLQWNGLIL